MDRSEGDRSRAGRDGLGRRAGLARALCAARVLATALAAFVILGVGGTSVDLEAGAGTPEAKARFVVEGRAAFDAMVAEQVAEQTAGRECWEPGTREGVIPTAVLVRGIAIGDGAGVVRPATFDQGWALAKAGKVWILKACA